MLSEFRAKLSENGRILIPSDCRKQLNLVPGEDLVLRIDHDELRIFSVQHAARKAQEAVKRKAKGKSLVQELKRQRQRDSKND